MANSRFDGKVVIVTGGARGIGRAIVEAFAREGAKVGIGHSGRSEAAAQEIIRGVGNDRAVSLPGDVADAKAVKGAIDKTLSTFGRLDIVVNNAGICPFTSVLDLSVEEFDRVQAVNTRSVFLMAQGAARFMKDHGGGAIVNVTSISGERFTNPQQLAYCTSKAAANMLTRGLAVTLSPYHIRVNGVLPGTVPTDINEDILAQPGVTDAIVERTPLKSLGECSDIASATLFLASNEAKWITGTLMVVDGVHWPRSKKVYSNGAQLATSSVCCDSLVNCCYLRFVKAHGHTFKVLQDKFQSAKKPDGADKEGDLKPPDGDKDPAGKQPEAAAAPKEKSPLPADTTGQLSIDGAALKSAILEAYEGSSISALAALEAAVCAKFGVQMFSSLGHGPSL